MQLALKVDVDTYRGTREGVPALMSLLDKHNVRATFLFSLGPDHTGRAIKRAFRPGFFSKVSRTSVVSLYGYKTLMYGVLLPGPDIGKKCAALMRSVQAAGHEVGIHTWDHVRWQDGVAGASDAWVEREVERATERFAEIFSSPAKTHGAAGWQMNDHALCMTEKLGFDYCSDGRGSSPFLPLVGDRIVRCPQLPTTLPTLDELIGVDDITTDNVARHMLSLTAVQPSNAHIYTLHTELEGGKLKGTFDTMLSGWKTQGYSLTSTRSVFESLQLDSLPVCRAIQGTVPGRSGTMFIQGDEIQ
jgi:undecaprenyl phosphate-alpha-L-ara4FN deformylase